MRRFNGTPREILEHTEMMELVLPTLRADFSLRDTYRHRTESPLGCAISAFGGMADRAVAVDKLTPWSAHTTGGSNCGCSKAITFSSAPLKRRWRRP
jgi:medium-chain acyl-[acyl-carrier-protein] hydrolase